MPQKCKSRKGKIRLGNSPRTQRKNKKDDGASLITINIISKSDWGIEEDGMETKSYSEKCWSGRMKMCIERVNSELPNYIPNQGTRSTRRILNMCLLFILSIGMTSLCSNT